MLSQDTAPSGESSMQTEASKPREDAGAGADGAGAIIPRPRGRGPKGKTWDGVSGEWISEASAVSVRVAPPRSCQY